MKTYKKFLLSLSIFISSIYFSNISVSAHAVVKPSETNISSWTTFTLSVPVERDAATTNVRLVVPEGLKHVIPNVKPGWQIEIKKEGSGESATVKELVWSQGKIPVGQRDEFIFSAQVPAQPTQLIWKTYQTYANGNVIGWEMDPKTENDEDKSNTGPYSITSVIDDINQQQQNKTQTNDSPGLISVMALLVSGAALALHFSRK